MHVLRNFRVFLGPAHLAKLLAHVGLQCWCIIGLSVAKCLFLCVQCCWSERRYSSRETSHVDVLLQVAVCANLTRQPT